jgi:hypothetical protein
MSRADLRKKASRHLDEKHAAKYGWAATDAKRRCGYAGT